MAGPLESPSLSLSLFMAVLRALGMTPGAIDGTLSCGQLVVMQSLCLILAALLVLVRLGLMPSRVTGEELLSSMSWYGLFPSRTETKRRL
jgi:hypothetical protein